jgi:hypothetical protein
LVKYNSFVYRISKSMGGASGEKSSFNVLTQSLHGLHGILEIAITAYQYCGVVGVSSRKAQHVNCQPDVNTLLCPELSWDLRPTFLADQLDT